MKYTAQTKRRSTKKRLPQPASGLEMKGDVMSYACAELCCAVDADGRFSPQRVLKSVSFK